MGAHQITTDNWGDGVAALSMNSEDNPTYVQGKIRAVFYPKFENENPNQEVRGQMLEMVSNAKAVLEVSLKHSGSLFMYAGHIGGAYSKNSHGNIHSIVGLFLLDQTFRKSWGEKAMQKQHEFNDFLERNRICVSMELVTAVLDDHGQHPREDYVIVTAVTNLKEGKPKFYSTQHIIAFCRMWRLPTNHVWLFSTRKSVTSFFTKYDQLWEVGTATLICNTLNEIADTFVPGIKDHIEAQGELLEGLVARLVSQESTKHIKELSKDFPFSCEDKGGFNSGPSLREIFSTHQFDNNKIIKELIHYIDYADHSDWYSRCAAEGIITEFLEGHPVDYSTAKLQELIHILIDNGFYALQESQSLSSTRSRANKVDIKCFNVTNKHDSVQLKMAIHVRDDSVFRLHQAKMRHDPNLWPLYRGFFFDINLKLRTDNSGGFHFPSSNIDNIINNREDSDEVCLMLKLKFLPYKLRTFLLRNGLPILFEGIEPFKRDCISHIKKWRTSIGNQEILEKLLDAWASFITEKYTKTNQLPSNSYLSEAEIFLQRYSIENLECKTLVVPTKYFFHKDLSAVDNNDGYKERQRKRELGKYPIGSNNACENFVQNGHNDLLIFFPGLPGCGKSMLCEEIISSIREHGSNRKIQTMTADLIEGQYWQQVFEECRKNKNFILLADKNAPNHDVWMKVKEFSTDTGISVVPVVPDSEGSPFNPYSLDDLAIFIFRVLQRENHPGNLDRNSPNVCRVLLHFYHLFVIKSRKEFESMLIKYFGTLVKMPLWKPNRKALPNAVKSMLEKGIGMYSLCCKSRLKWSKSDLPKELKTTEWVGWEKELREVLFDHGPYFCSVQVPAEYVASNVLQQLTSILAKVQRNVTSSTVTFAAINISLSDIQACLPNLYRNSEANLLLRGKKVKSKIKRAHVTLAHKQEHGIDAVQSYLSSVNRSVQIEVKELICSDDLAALGVHLVPNDDGESIVSKNVWPHITLWTGKLPPKEANKLPELLCEGKAKRVEIVPPVTLSGIIKLY